MAVDNYVSELVGNDCLFELDSFNNPKLCSESETIKNALLYILFSKPGQYPSIPTLGMDIRSLLYSYYDEISEDDLQDRLVEQCAAFNPYFKVGDISIRKMMYRNSPSLLIYISTETYVGGDDGFDNSPFRPLDKEFYIGLTLDEVKELVFNISSRPVKR